MWPFDQPANCATVTTTHVMRDRAPVTHVYHDEHDHGWQFLSDHESSTADLLLVTLGSIIALDESLTAIADLPPGWMARRESIDAPWQRSLQYADACQVIVDWSGILSEEDFYDAILPQCGSPAWHGRNLDALADSWITGGIDTNGPPHAFGFYGMRSTRSDLISFRDKVLEIADESIAENGGRHLQQGEIDALIGRKSGG